MISLRDYTMSTQYLDDGQPTVLRVCATNQIDAISACWTKLPKSRHSLVDAFKILRVDMCAHTKKVV